MQLKLSKHFIYNWLHEDAYGEFLFHANKNNIFTQNLLLRVWKFLLFKANTFQRIGAISAPRYTAFTSSLLRTRFLRRYKHILPISLLGRVSVFTSLYPPIKTYTWYKLFVLNKLFSNKFNYLTKQFKKSNYQNLGTKKTNLKKFSWLRYMYFLRRRRRRLFIIRRKKILALRRLQKRNLKLFRIKKKRLVFQRLTGRMRFKNNIKKFNVRSGFFYKRWGSAFRKKRKSHNFFRVTLRRYLKFSLNFFKSVKRGPFSNNWVNSGIWRFLYSNIKTSWTPLRLRTTSLTHQKLKLLLQRQTLFKIWDNLAYCLRIKTYKFLNSRRSKKLSFRPRFSFVGTFKKNKKLVKKNEKNCLLQYRLLLYYNVITNPHDYYLVRTKFLNITKNFRIPSLSYLEFQLSVSLLRASFFENGYVVHSLTKRGLFLINGTRVLGNVTIQPWDIITILKPVWWLVYARFVNYFSNVITKKNHLPLFTRKIIPQLFLKKVFSSRWLLRKFKSYRKSRLSSSRLTAILNSKNLVFFRPPAYMEVSYKLFMFVIHKLVSKSSELTYSPHIKNLKFFLPASSTSLSSVLKLAH